MVLWRESPAMEISLASTLKQPHSLLTHLSSHHWGVQPLSARLQLVGFPSGVSETGMWVHASAHKVGTILEA